MVPRTGKSVPKGKIPVASTSAHPQLQEPPDDGQDEEADGDVVPDEFDADWSRDVMCVADPFVVTKVRTPLHYGGVAQRQCLPELCRPNHEVYLCPVRTRM